MKLGRVVFVLPLFLLFCFSATAQSHGQAAVSGTVRDSSGGALPGVTVTVRSAADPSDSGSVAYTEMDGAFRVAGLRPGAYVVETAGQRVERSRGHGRRHPGAIIGSASHTRRWSRRRPRSSRSRNADG